MSSSLWDTSSRSGFSVTTIHRRHADGPRKSSFSLLGGGITAWILAEFPGKILHAAAYGTSHPVLSHSYWREAWYIYDMTYVITGFEMVAVGIYALTDKSKSPVWPRWAGWVAIGGALSFVPESAVPYVTTGPFAVNGLWNFWIAFPWWLIWFGIFTYYMLRYVRRQMSASAAEPVEPPVEVAPEMYTGSSTATVG